MKLALLIAVSILLSVTEVILLCVAPKKTNKIVFLIIALIVFLVVLYVHPQIIRSLSILWGLESHAKVILRISYVLTLITCIAYK